MPKKSLLLAAIAFLGVAAGWAAHGAPLETSFGLRPAALGADVIHFDEIQAENFRALAVDRDHGAPRDRPLIVRFNVVGPAPDMSRAEAWLRDHANVFLVRDPQGAPLVFTDKDLATDRGNAALGATVPRGIAVETRDKPLLDCVIVHEVIHFLGLHHVDSERDIMNARCDAGKPFSATFDERSELDRLRSIRALTLSGRVTWAERI